MCLNISVPFLVHSFHGRLLTEGHNITYIRTHRCKKIQKSRERQRNVDVTFLETQGKLYQINNFGTVSCFTLECESVSHFRFVFGKKGMLNSRAGDARTGVERPNKLFTL